MTVINKDFEVDIQGNRLLAFHKPTGRLRFLEAVGPMKDGKMAALAHQKRQDWEDFLNGR